MRGRTNVTAATSVFAVVKKNTNNQQKKDGRVRKEGEGGWLWKAVSRGMRQSRLLRERITERRKKKGVNNKRWREPHSSTPSPAATFSFLFTSVERTDINTTLSDMGKNFIDGLVAFLQTAWQWTRCISTELKFLPIGPLDNCRQLFQSPDNGCSSHNIRRPYRNLSQQHRKEGIARQLRDDNDDLSPSRAGYGGTVRY